MKHGEESLEAAIKKIQKYGAGKVPPRTALKFWKKYNVDISWPDGEPRTWLPLDMSKLDLSPGLKTFEERLPMEAMGRYADQVDPTFWRELNKEHKFDIIDPEDMPGDMLEYITSNLGGPNRDISSVGGAYFANQRSIWLRNHKSASELWNSALHEITHKLQDIYGREGGTSTANIFNNTLKKLNREFFDNTKVVYENLWGLLPAKYHDELNRRLDGNRQRIRIGNSQPTTFKDEVVHDFEQLVKQANDAGELDPETYAKAYDELGWLAREALDRVDFPSAWRAGKTRIAEHQAQFRQDPGAFGGQRSRFAWGDIDERMATNAYAHNIGELEARLSGLSAQRFQEATLTPQSQADYDKLMRRPAYYAGALEPHYGDLLEQARKFNLQPRIPALGREFDGEFYLNSIKEGE